MKVFSITHFLIALAALLTFGACQAGEFAHEPTPQAQKEAVQKKTANTAKSADGETVEVGNLVAFLNTTQNGIFWQIAVEMEVRVKGTGEFRAALNADLMSSETHTLDLPVNPGEILEIVPVSEPTCYADGVPKDCTYEGSDPAEFTVLAGATLPVHLFFLADGGVIVVCNPGDNNDGQITFETAVLDNDCDDGCDNGMECVAKFGCRARCGGEDGLCDEPENGCVVPLIPQGQAQFGVCVGPT